MKKLPKGKVNMDEVLRNARLIELLISDEIFLQSVEESEGKVKRIWPDWNIGKLIYEMQDGSLKESDLKLILDKLKKINYEKEFNH